MFIQKLATFFNNVDKRIIFFMVALAVMLPLLNPLGLKIKPSPNSVEVYNQIEALKPGDRILMSFDYDPASAPELQPMANSVLRHCFKKGIRVVACSLWAPAPPLAMRAFKDTKRDISGKMEYSDKTYGVDFINLGAHPNYLAAVKSMGSNFPMVWGKAMEYNEDILTGIEAEFDHTRNVIVCKDGAFRDKGAAINDDMELINDKGEKVTGRIRAIYSNTEISFDGPLPKGEKFKYRVFQHVSKKDLSEYEITKDIKNYDAFKLIFSLTTGTVGLTTYVQIAKTQFNVEITGGCTAVSSLELYPYIQSKQLNGLLEGMKGASDYEELTKYPGKRVASQAMEPQSVVHLLIIFFILIANFTYYVEKRYGLLNEEVKK